ncbi:MAG: TIGR01777 family protein [Deltaproteobacteria bacterium]|nr:TIGR01777 family protein [Deltaproteobacteria bacterium]
MRYFIMGGTGFVGRHLVEKILAGGDQAVLLVRPGSEPPAAKGLETITGNPFQAGAWAGKARSCDVVVNLVGSTIMTRWTAKARERIMATRVDSTRAAVQALGKEGTKTLLCANAIGFYGDGGDHEQTENTPAGTGFLAEICQAWQKEAEKAKNIGHRVCIMRFGAVLGPGGGALAKMLPPFRLGLGGPVGGGRQWFSWVHVQDVAEAIQFLAGEKSAQGVFNICAPDPVRNREFALALGRVLNRPAFLPFPGWVLRLAMGQASDVVLASQRCLPRRLQDAGFRFSQPSLVQALADIVNEQARGKTRSRRNGR